MELISKHKTSNQMTSQKKLKFVLKGLQGITNVVEVLRLLEAAATIKKPAFLLLKTLYQCINNMRNELKQKNLEICDKDGKVEFQIGRSTGLRRMIYRAKGSRSPIHKHRAYIAVNLTNKVKEKAVEVVKESV